MTIESISVLLRNGLRLSSNKTYVDLTNILVDSPLL